MTSIELLKQDLDAELKLGTKMVVNWDMYIEMHKQEIIDAFTAGEDNIDNDGCTIGRNGKETYYNEKFKKDL